MLPRGQRATGGRGMCDSRNQAPGPLEELLQLLDNVGSIFLLLVFGLLLYVIIT